jgi:gliding motility-associated-like protein
VNLIPGNYCVTVTDANGCTANACVTVPNTSGVIASITSQTPTSCNTVCDATATAAGAGGVAPYTYSWNTIPAQLTQNASSLCAGTYIVTVMDNSGCSDTASVIISEPTLVVTAPISNITICNSGTAVLTASASGGNGAPYSYAWTPVGTPSGSPITVSPAATTVYTVNASDANGCPAAPVNVTVTVNPPLSVVAAGTASVCPGSSATISAAAANGNGGPYTYSWMPGSLSGSSVSVTPGTTTTYTVTANDGCSPAVTDVVTITVLPVPVVVISSNVTSGCAPLCVNFSDLSTVAGGDTVNVWSWSFSDGGSANIENPTHCFANAGNYDVSLTVTSSAGGCSSSLTNTAMISVYPIPTADFTAPLSTSILNPTVPFTDNSLGANTWDWDFNDPLNPGNDSSNAQNPTYTFSDVGTYCVDLIVTSVNGCQDNTTLCVVIDPEFTFFIPNAFSPNGDGVNDEFYGKGDFINSFEMYIYDRWGNMIFFSDDINKHWDGTANHGAEIAQQDTYVYVVKLTDNKDKKHKYLGSVTLVK